MNLSTIIRPECVAVHTETGDKEKALELIAELAKRSSVLAATSQERIVEALREREKIGSTGFDDGVAIPHCRLDDVEDFTVGLLAAPAGFDFDADDDKKSTLLFFIIAPESRREEHIRILSAISRLCAMKNNRETLLQQKDSTSLREALLSRLPEEAEPKPMSENSVFHIAVQREDIFNDILEEVTALTPSVSVVEARDAVDYLHSLPLFSTFWSEESKGFHRLITGQLNRRLVNELIRGLDALCGGLEQSSGVSVTVQDALISAGSLNP